MLPTRTPAASSASFYVDAAVARAHRFGGPVVMKIVFPDIPHKTDAGVVVVGVAGAAEVRAAYHEIVENARAYDPDARIDGVQVQELLPRGQEVIVGAVTDPTFGKVVAFGLGGVLVEVLKDGRAFVAAARETVPKKPLVVLKAGRRRSRCAPSVGLTTPSWSDVRFVRCPRRPRRTMPTAARSRRP